MTEMGKRPFLPTEVILDLLQRSGAPAYDQHMIGAVLTSNTSDQTKFRQLTALTACQVYEPADPGHDSVEHRSAADEGPAIRAPATVSCGGGGWAERGVQIRKAP
jgi:hypothetical protein